MRTSIQIERNIVALQFALRDAKAKGKNTFGLVKKIAKMEDELKQARQQEFLAK